MEEDPWFGGLGEDEQRRPKTQQQRMEEDEWGKPAVVTSGHEFAGRGGAKKAEAFSRPKSAMVPKNEEEDLDDLMNDIVQKDKEEGRKPVAAAPQREERGLVSGSIFTDLFGEKKGKEESKVLDKKSRSIREQLFLGSRSKSQSKGSEESKKMESSPEAEEAEQVKSRNEALQSQYPKSQEQQEFPAVNVMEGFKSEFRSHGTENIVGMSRRGKSKLLAKPQTAGEKRPEAPLSPLLPEAKPPKDPSRHEVMKAAKGGAGVMEEKKKVEDNNEYAIDDDDLPLVSPVEKKGGKKNVPRVEEEEDDNMSSGSYHPTISDNEKPRAQSPALPDPRKGLNPSRLGRSSRPQSAAMRDDSTEAKPEKKPTETAIPKAHEPVQPVTVPKYEPEYRPAPEPEEKKEFLIIREQPLAGESFAMLVTSSVVKAPVVESPAKIKLKEYANKLQELQRRLSDVEGRNALLKSENRKLQIGAESEEQQLKRQQEKRRREEERHSAEIAKLNELHSRELMKLTDTHRKTARSTELDKDRVVELEKKIWDREKQRLEQMHKMEIDALDKQNRQNLEKAKRQIEFDNEAVKKQLEREVELSKLTTQVDSLVEAMKAKMEEELRGKLRALEQKEKELDEARLRLKLEQDSSESERLRVAELEAQFASKESQHKAIIGEYKKLYEMLRDSTDGQHIEWQQEESLHREETVLDCKQLELDFNNFLQKRKEWEADMGEQFMSIAMDKKLIEKQRQDYYANYEEQLEGLNAKIVALDYKKEALASDESELLKRTQHWEDKKIVFKREEEEMELKLEKFAVEKKQLEEEKGKMEVLAQQVEEESKVVYRYKSAVDKTRQDLEQMHAEVEIKAALLATEKAKLEGIRKELESKQKAMESSRLQGGSVAESFIQLQESIARPRVMYATTPAGFLPQPRGNAQPMMGLSDSFRASEFIRDLEKDFGRPARFTEYLVDEKSTLIRSKRELGDQKSHSLMGFHPSSSRKHDI